MRRFSIPRSTCRAVHGTRPRLEALEERTLLSVDSVPGLKGWSGGGIGAAGGAVVNFLDTGWYDQTGFHDAANDNYLTGRSGGVEFRSFYVFNVPNTRTIVGAQLRIYNPIDGYLSPDPTETFTLFNVSTPVAALRAGGSGQIARFNDLGDGPMYGTQTVSTADNDRIVTVTLNAAAVADLNDARGQAFAIGGRNTTLGAEDGRFFRFSGGPDAPRQLVLELAEPAGPIIINHAPQVVADALSAIRVTFDRPINPATFTTADVTEFTGQLGLIEPTAVTPVPNTNNTQFDVTFPLQSITGVYGMAIGPNIADTNGNLMDQNTDGATGTFDDRYLAIFTLEGARVLQATSGTVGAPVDRLRVTFNRAMDPATFPDWVLLQGPAGAIPITGAEVSGLGGRQIDVLFAPQSDTGVYTYTMAAGVRDVWGNPLDQNRNNVGGEIPADNFTGSFRVVPGGCFGSDAVYSSCVAPFEDINLAPGQPDVITLISGCDDCTATVNLGGSSFRFYGSTFTSLFVSSNGLVTFGNANSSFVNTDLTSFPAERTIAALWDDWLPNAAGMVLGKLEGDRLILEWNGVRHIAGPPANITFQMILQLNTGATPGNIWFNYVDLNANDPSFNDGRDATVGIKDQGTQGPNRILVSFNALTDFVRSGRAIVFTTMPGAGPTGGGGAVLAALQSTRENANVRLPVLADTPVERVFGSTDRDALRMDLPHEEVVHVLAALRADEVDASLFELVL